VSCPHLSHFCNSQYESHHTKLTKIKNSIDEMKTGKEAVIDERHESLKMRVISNRMKSHDFNEQGMHPKGLT
jgi:hypothetical protein